MGALRSAEDAAAERDAALAGAAALREQLGELKRERSQLEHYKQVCAACWLWPGRTGCQRLR